MASLYWHHHGIPRLILVLEGLRHFQKIGEIPEGKCQGQIYFARLSNWIQLCIYPASGKNPYLKDHQHLSVLRTLRPRIRRLFSICVVLTWSAYRLGEGTLANHKWVRAPVPQRTSCRKWWVEIDLLKHGGMH